MKKIFLFIGISLLAFVALCVFYLVPKTFHNTVHQEIIAKQWPPSQIQLTKHGLGESESLVNLSPTSKLKVRSVSFVNPLSNYINVDYIDTAAELDINFQIYAHLNGVSSLKLEAKFSDEHIIHKNTHFEVKDLSIFLENLKLSDLKALVNNNTHALLGDKQISLKAQKIILKSGSTVNSLDGLDMALGNNIDNESLAFDFSTEIKSFVNKNLEEKLGLTTTKINLSLSSFEKNMALQFLSTIPKKSIVNRSPPSVFEVLPYIRSIRYPLEFKLRALAEDGTDQIGLSVDAALKEQAFLSLSSYAGALEFKNKKEYTVALIKEIILASFPKSTARFYSLSEGAPPDKRFLERGQVEKIITETLREDMKDKGDEILAVALELGVIKPEDNLYKTNLRLEEGKFDLNSKQYVFNELKRIPSEMILKLYPKELMIIPKLLKSKGLYLVPPM